jgi:hypothetical protein
LQGHDHGSSADKPRESWAEEFWDGEDRRLSAVVDVVITRGKSVSAPALEHAIDHIRARMSISGVRLQGSLVYMVTFQRPILRQPSSIAQPEDGAPDSECTNSNRNNDEVSLPEDNADREAQVHRMVSTAIPYFTALFDSDGQAVHFSTSWYSVTDMNEEKTMGKAGFKRFMLMTDKP